MTGIIRQAKLGPIWTPPPLPNMRLALDRLLAMIRPFPTLSESFAAPKVFEYNYRQVTPPKELLCHIILTWEAQ